MKIGPYTLSSIETCTFGLDGGAMFGIVPKPLWEKTNPADEANRIDMHCRALLIQGEGRNILVDTGMGLKWADKFINMYKIDHSRFALERSLNEKGLKPEDITDVILTHLHFDHAGGMTYRDGEDLVPVFTNAKVWVQERNWELAWHPTEKDQASYLSENYAPYQQDSGFKNKLELIQTRATDPTGRTAFSGPDSEETQILPGISVEVSHGHTLGMQLVRVKGDDGKNLIYCADLIPTSTHVRIPYIMGYDCFPMFILAEKKRLLNRAVDENTFLFYEHCPHHAATTVVRTPKGDFAAGEAVVL